MGTGEKLTGEQYSRRMHAPTEHYRMDSQNHVLTKNGLQNILKTSRKWKNNQKFSKCPDREFRSQEDFGRLANVGCPDYYEPAEYWKGLAGTTGEITPIKSKQLTNGSKN